MTYAFVKGDNQISINDFVDEQPGQYDFKVDTLNNILVIRALDGGYKAEIHALSDTVTINEDEFTGTAVELKTQLLADIFINNEDAVDLSAVSTDIIITDNSKGLVLKSPNNTQFRLTANNDGSLTTTAI